MHATLTTLHPAQLVLRGCAITGAHVLVPPKFQFIGVIVQTSSTPAGSSRTTMHRNGAILTPAMLYNELQRGILLALESFTDYLHLRTIQCAPQPR